MAGFQALFFGLLALVMYGRIQCAKNETSKYINKSESNETETHLSVEDFQAAENVSDADQEEFVPKNQIRKGLFQGDIAMEKAEEIVAFKEIFRSDNFGPQKSALSNPLSYWPGGEIPYVLSSRYTPTSKKILAAALGEFEARTCLKFVPQSSQNDYISIKPVDGCYSYLGRQGGSQEVSLDDGCFKIGTIIHELLHVVGFIHEQSRPDRDKFVKILYSNVKPGLEGQFTKLPSRLINTLNTTYDYGSVMHYGRAFFSANGRDTIQPLKAGVEIGQREGFSDMDVLRVNRLYNCDEKIGLTTTERPIESTSEPETEISKESCKLRVRSRTYPLRNQCVFLQKSRRSSWKSSYILKHCENGSLSKKTGSLFAIKSYLRSHNIYSRYCRYMLEKGHGKCCGDSSSSSSSGANNGNNSTGSGGNNWSSFGNNWSGSFRPLIIRPRPGSRFRPSGRRNRGRD